MSKLISLLAGLSTCIFTTIFCGINFSSQQSTISLPGGSLLIIGNDISGWNGTLVLNPEATITGSSISFSSGVFSNGQQDVTFSGTYNQDGSITVANSGVMSITSKTDLTQTLTFNGACTLNGNGNTINMLSNGKILIEKGSSLLFNNITLKGVGNGNIFCMDNSGTLSFQNVTMYQSADYTFSIGHIDIISNLYIGGGYKFNYTSPIPSTIGSYSTLFLDRNVTFSYDPGIMSKNLIVFENNFSTLQLNGATLHATLTGMNLTTGTLIVSQNSFIESEQSDLLDEGITFGSDFGDDLTLQILASTKLELTTGSLKYKNMIVSSCIMQNAQSNILLDGGCNLYLYQNLNLGIGQLTFIGGNIYYTPGSIILGTVNAIGQINSIEI